MKHENPQAPQAPRSGAAAEGPIDVTQSHPVAEGRQSPGRRDIAEHTTNGWPDNLAPATPHPPVPAGLAACPWCQKAPGETLLNGDRIIACETENCPAEGYPYHEMDWPRRALAAPGAPQGGDPTAYVSPAFAPLYASEAKRRGYIPSPQEEGPAGVDPQVIDLLNAAFASAGAGKAFETQGDIAKALEILRSQEVFATAQAPASSPRSPRKPSPAAVVIAQALEHGGQGDEHDQADAVMDALEEMGYSITHRDASPRDLEAGDLDAIQGVIEIAANGNLNAHEEEILDAARLVLADLRLAAHPPKGETPSEAAGLEAAYRAGYANGHGDATTEHRDGYDVPGVEKHLEAYLETLPPAPGTPIEKAAREAGALRSTLRDVLAEFHSLSMAIRERCAGSSVLGDILERMEEVIDGSRASLSSLPQEPAPGDRCQSCGWKDEDHSEAGGIPVCPNLPPETLWQEIEGVCDALPECPDKIIPGLAAAVDANVKAGMEWMRRAESQAGAQEPKEGGAA